MALVRARLVPMARWLPAAAVARAAEAVHRGPGIPGVLVDSPVAVAVEPVQGQVPQPQAAMAATVV